jgi:multiple sugar transport system ATP-binding protein
LTKVPAVERDARVAKAVGILHLQPLVDRKPAAFSGDQRQRVELGRSIMRNPQVFFVQRTAFQPGCITTHPDAGGLAEPHEHLAVTMAYVTHGQVEAMILADQIVFMNAGRVEQIGGPDELYQHPQTIFVATFIGSPKINLLTGPVADERGAATYCICPSRKKADGQRRSRSPSIWATRLFYISQANWESRRCGLKKTNALAPEISARHGRRRL